MENHAVNLFLATFLPLFFGKLAFIIYKTLPYLPFVVLHILLVLLQKTWMLLLALSIIIPLEKSQLGGWVLEWNIFLPTKVSPMMFLMMGKLL